MMAVIVEFGFLLYYYVKMKNNGGRKSCVSIGDVVNGRHVLEKLPKRDGYNACRWLVSCVQCETLAEVFGFSMKWAGCPKCAAIARGKKQRGQQVNFSCGTESKYTQGCRCESCRAANAAMHRNYRKTVQGKRSVKRMNLRKFGLTLEKFQSLIESQNGLCAICEVRPDILCVDHCHKTGKVRGLLCHGCNRGIGLIGDCPHILKKAAIYVERS